MDVSEFTYKTKDNQSIFTKKWVPEINKTKACIQIAHGMAEHIQRYSHFAEEMVKAGFAVYGNDHRGHGKTAGSLENIGYFADINGFNIVVEDMIKLTEIIKEENPGKPIFLFGHSMGSLLSRNYIINNSNYINGVILSGTMGSAGLLGIFGIGISKFQCWLKGQKAKSPLMDSLSFGQFNNAFKPNRTDFDWLTSDKKEVDKYMDDPYCGSIFSTGFFYDLLTGMYETFKSKNTAKIPKDLPMFIFSGDKDPVGNNKKAVEKVFQNYKKAGLKKIALKFYDGRHEMLNEINKSEVYQDIIHWINTQLENT